jgi:hypothetical protein
MAESVQGARKGSLVPSPGCPQGKSRSHAGYPQGAPLPYTTHFVYVRGAPCGYPGPGGLLYLPWLGHDELYACLAFDRVV